jgi:hypothetical protein
MFVLPHQYARTSASPEGRSSLPIPTVYEQVPSRPVHWEYQVLSIETRETPFLSTENLNVLGKEGWMMVGLQDERATGHDTKVHYYFMRQSSEE